MVMVLRFVYQSTAIVQISTLPFCKSKRILCTNIMIHHDSCPDSFTQLLFMLLPRKPLVAARDRDIYQDMNQDMNAYQDMNQDMNA